MVPAGVLQYLPLCLPPTDCCRYSVCSSIETNTCLIYFMEEFWGTNEIRNVSRILKVQNNVYLCEQNLIILLYKLFSPTPKCGRDIVEAWQEVRICWQHRVSTLGGKKIEQHIKNHSSLKQFRALEKNISGVYVDRVKGEIEKINRIQILNRLVYFKRSVFLTLTW